MSSYIAFAIVCLIVFGSVSWILRIEKQGIRGPGPVSGLDRDRERPVCRIDSGSLRSREEINAMLADCMAQLRAIGVPISESISPSVVLSRTRAGFGDGRKTVDASGELDYDFVIRLSKYTLANSERSLRNTIYHELIHTVPGGFDHGRGWKKWAAYASERLGYHIQRVGGGDDTAKDLENLSFGVITPKKKSNGKRGPSPVRRERLGRACRFLQ